MLSSSSASWSQIALTFTFFSIPASCHCRRRRRRHITYLVYKFGAIFTVYVFSVFSFFFLPPPLPLSLKLMKSENGHNMWLCFFLAVNFQIFLLSNLKYTLQTMHTQKTTPPLHFHPVKLWQVRNFFPEIIPVFSCWLSKNFFVSMHLSNPTPAAFTHYYTQTLTDVLTRGRSQMLSLLMFSFEGVNRWVGGRSVCLSVC